MSCRCMISAVCVPLFISLSVGARAQVCDEWELQVNDPGVTRNSHRMVYDSRRGVTVTFGGKDSFPAGYNEIRETSEWDGEAWVVRSTTGPGPRQRPGMGYDSRRGVTVLFGGVRAGPGAHFVFLGDTWEWDGGSWVLRSEVGPSPRSWAAMAFDSRRGVTVLFGGHSPTAYYSEETWEWDGAAWTLRATGSPHRRLDPAMAFDSVRGVVVMFGGVGAPDTLLRDLWEWDGTGWTERTRPGGPSARYGHALAFDSARGVTLLFGGRSPAQAVIYDDLWAWDGDHWTEAVLTGPSARFDHAMTFDDRRHALVLHGGAVDQRNDVGDTWELITFCDEDQDGIEDNDDGCPNSDLGETVSIDRCDSGVSNQLFGDGCTMADRIAECADDARNHGGFVSCVGDLVDGWAEEDVIDPNQKGGIVRCAGKADILARPAPKLLRGNSERSKAERVDAEPTERLSRP